MVSSTKRGITLLVAMMIVPEKENWRHVFDLTRFSERPNKLDPGDYRKRVQQALFTKLECITSNKGSDGIEAPAEIQSMIGNPRLVELAYSKERKYSQKSSQRADAAIRRWGGGN